MPWAGEANDGESASVEAEVEVDPRAFRWGLADDAKQEKRPEVHIFGQGSHESAGSCPVPNRQLFRSPVLHTADGP